jgi:flagellar protein FliO/FliZ
MTVLVFVRVVLSLAVVLGILAAAAKFARRGGLVPAGPRAVARVEVVARQGLGRNSSVIVVRAVERALVLGVTETSVTLLADTDASVLVADEPEPGAPPGMVDRPSAWKVALEQVRERTVRRS